MLVRVLKDGDAEVGEKETVSTAQTSSFTGRVMCFLGYLHALGEGHGNPFQYSWLENPMDRGAWQATVHVVAKSQTQMSDQVYTRMHTHTQNCIYASSLFKILRTCWTGDVIRHFRRVH